MKGSLVIVGFFAAGLLLSRLGLVPDVLLEHDVSIYVLYLLMFLVGMGIGGDGKALQALKEQQFKILWVPVATVVGTLAGSAAAAPFLTGRSLADCLAVGSGFGYYSLSSVIISGYKGAELGTLALTSNILRELMTLLGAPVLVWCFGRLAPVCAGGATTMDTTLPVISRYAGKEFVVISIFHGLVVDFSVPFLVTFFCSL